MTPCPDYGSPMSFAKVPDLMPSAFDDATTDSSPSPPMVIQSCLVPCPQPDVDSFRCTRASTIHTIYTQILLAPNTSNHGQTLSTLLNLPTSPKFSMKTADEGIQTLRKTKRQPRTCALSVVLGFAYACSLHEPFRETRLTTPQRRRAQNRASQRAFRERKEKHVQHLEHELEELETKHQNLSKSYTDLDSTHSKLKREVQQLRAELETMRTPRDTSMDQKTENSFFDPFATDSFFGDAPDMRF